MSLYRRREGETQPLDLPPPDPPDYSAAPTDEPPEPEPEPTAEEQACLRRGLEHVARLFTETGPATSEETNTMGKNEAEPEPKPAEAPTPKRAGQFTQEERRVLLEATRGLGDKALKELDKAGKLGGVSRTTIYMWRKELWGTMNAHGLHVDGRTHSGRQAVVTEIRESEAMEEDEGEEASGRLRLTGADKIRMVKEADASGNVAEYARTHGVHFSTIYTWRKQIASGEITKTSPAIRTKFSEEERKRLAKDALASGNVTEYAEKHGLSRSALTKWASRYRIKSPSQQQLALPGERGKVALPEERGKVGSDGRVFRTDQEKQELVRQAYSSGMPISHWAAEHGQNPNLLRKWKTELEAAGRERRQHGGHNRLVSEETKRAMIADYTSGRLATYKDVATKYGFKVGTVNSIMTRAGAKRARSGDAQLAAQGTDEDVINSYEQERAAKRMAREQARALVAYPVSSERCQHCGADPGELEDLRLQNLVLRGRMELAKRRGYQEDDVSSMISGGQKKRRGVTHG